MAIGLLFEVAGPKLAHAFEKALSIAFHAGNTKTTFGGANKHFKLRWRLYQTLNPLLGFCVISLRLLPLFFTRLHSMYDNQIVSFKIYLILAPTVKDLAMDDSQQLSSNNVMDDNVMDEEQGKDIIANASATGLEVETERRWDPMSGPKDSKGDPVGAAVTFDEMVASHW